MRDGASNDHGHYPASLAKARNLYSYRFVILLLFGDASSPDEAIHLAAAT